MKNIYKKFQAALFVVMALAGTACDDKDDSGSVPPPGPEATPVELTVSSGYYYSQDNYMSSDHYTLFLSNGEAVQHDNVFSGGGTGVCLDLYAPLREQMDLPVGSYEIREPHGQNWHYAICPKSEADSSYLYLGPDTAPLDIVSGTVTVGQSGTKYTVSGTVRCSDDKYYALSYSGELNLKNRPMPSEWLTEYADYTKMHRCAGIYFGTVMVETNDNYSFYLMSEDIIDQGGVFEGAGTAISFDLYAPLGSGAEPVNGVYTLFDEDVDKFLDYKYKRGEDYGGGMLQGSYIFKRESDDAEKVYVYVIGGTLTVGSENGFYRILIDVQGDDSNSYKFKYIGRSLNVLDPFSGM